MLARSLLLGQPGSRLLRTAPVVLQQHHHHREPAPRLWDVDPRVPRVEFEDPRREQPPLQATVEMPTGFCVGCGSRFQCDDAAAPGFVPANVLEERAEGAAAPSPQSIKPRRAAVCQRCHGLRYQNKLNVDTLRVGVDESAGGHAKLQPEYFRDLLRSLAYRSCVIVCVVDLFDFHGSLMPDLPRIVGKQSTLLLVGNKLDLLPAGVNVAAVERWVRAECREAGLPPLQSLDLVSCKTGANMPQLMRRIERLMVARRSDAYVLGAANAGKSSFLNYCIEHANAPKGRRGKGGKKARGGGGRPGANGGKADEALTISALPGTTLGFVKAAVLGGRQALYDTPGLILPNQLTTLLHTDELASVVPKKRSQHVTLRLGEGKSVLLGGIARLHFRSGLPFLFTFYCANDVSLHQTATEKVEEVLAEQIGGMLSPPASAERLAELGTFEEQTFEVEGRGWQEVAVDLVLPGLGWVAVTGCGSCTVGVSLPAPLRALQREPILPSESTKKTLVKFTGSKLVDKKGHMKRRA